VGIARVSLIAGLVLALDGAAASADDASAPASLPDLSRLSIEQLANIDITSVSKTPEALSDAPAAVYVITHDDIIRSGATTLPEMLRLAPNLEVAQIDAQSYAISARGFNLYGADKLLVLIDGRSVYTPFFSGVFWDQQNVPPEDIDRIEVISGPGATLWGANAVNGVINIITKKSSDTQGGFVDAGAGNKMYDGTAQYGSKIGQYTTYRAYGEGLEQLHDDIRNGSGASDGWRREQGGFRVDWNKDADLVTVQGDIYQNPEQNLNLAHDVATESSQIAGRNLLARWTRQWDGGSTTQVQTYYDYNARLDSADVYGGDRLSIYDVDAQDSFSLGTRNAFVAGGGYRIEQDEINDNFATVPAVLFEPASATLDRSNVFLQDTITLTDTLKLTPGIKIEKDAYVSVEPLPSVRLAWKLDDRNLIWAAISRAARAPSREDRNLNEVYLTTKPPLDFFAGNDFQSEKLNAYELGYRAEPVSRVSVSVSTYYNVYQDLRSIGVTQRTAFPIYFNNDMQGDTYGAETWATYQVLSWWRLTAGFNLSREKLEFKPGTPDISGLQAAGNDPGHQASLRSSMDLSRSVTLDADLRQVGSLPNPQVSAYTELDARLGWKISDAFNVSLSGFNLLRAHHLEFIATSVRPPTEVGRTFYVKAQWRF
jgi:iron complex outermembrane receptor protein